MKKYKVYLTTLDDGRYYFGYSGKEGAAWDKYFGSSKIVKEYPGEKMKVILHDYDSKAHAQYRELLYQINHLNQPKCLNGIMHIRVNTKNLSDFH